MDHIVAQSNSIKKHISTIQLNTVSFAWKIFVKYFVSSNPKETKLGHRANQQIKLYNGK